ncbi:MAG: PP2C family protein-serine/threonine phosphatase [Thermoanaerobaculales bacterium]
MTKRRRWWLAAGAMLFTAAALAVNIDSESSVAGFFVFLTLLWLVASAWMLGLRAWRWMTYRVGVRLFFSYLLLGVLPFVFFAAFTAVGLYILAGQYTSVRFGSEMRRVRWNLAEDCNRVLRVLERAGPEAAAERLREMADDPPEPLPRVAWQARFGDEFVALNGGESLPEITWVAGEKRHLMVQHGADAYALVASSSESGDRVVALIPLDDATAAAISGAWWFDVALFSVHNGQIEDQGSGEKGGESVNIEASNDGSIHFTLDGETWSGGEIWPAWPVTEGGFLSRPLIVWFRVAVDLVDIDSGETLESSNLLALLRTSPNAVWNDFILSRYELGAHIWAVLLGLGLFFLAGYTLALTVSVALILSITRSVKRLSVGARQVERGNLDYRVPVKRHDELADLARSFNHMTGSVQSMLADVAEKERLAQELELARQIQESLLPSRYIEFGKFSIHTSFQPAAEVGGDYFDVFSMSDRRLVLTVGDVAGHGLSTGLLMASLKSSVAALVHEGYSGPDLIEKVNHLLVDHSQKLRMVTLTVVEIDPADGSFVLANAGHPPAFLLTADGGVEELMAGSIPMGSRLCRPVSLHGGFPPGSRLVLYSDGLVEAASRDGIPFGYDRLAQLLRETSDLSGTALIARILESLTEFSEGTAPADDLTLVVLERRV